MIGRTLWGRISSINVQKAAWALDEVGQPYERREAGGAFGIVDSADYRRMNPNGLVPVLEEPGGFALWESNVIVRYLASAHPESGLWPDDAKGRARADQWMDWQATYATPSMRDAFWHLIRLPEGSRDMALVGLSVHASAASARILDAHLADHAYVAGEGFSVADIAVGCHVKRWLALPIERPPLAHVESWFARVSERPAARAVMAVPLT